MFCCFCSPAALLLLHLLNFFSLRVGFLVLLLSLSISGSPPRDSPTDHKEIVGQATNIITAKLLKGGVDHHKNSVFSPIGFAAILAVLGDGASDDSNHDIITLLKHPNDRATVRAAYRSTLAHLQGSDPQAAPQFRSWFYIYKNNTIDDAYRRMLTDDYFVTVRDVEPYNPDDFLFAVTPSEKTLASDDELDTSELSDVRLKSNVGPIPVNSKDVVEFDALKKESEPMDETRIDTQKDASKFDEVVEDRQYVEVPVIKGGLKAEPAAIVNSVDGSRPADEPKAFFSIGSASGEPERISLPLKQYEEMEIMRAQETRLGKSVNSCKFVCILCDKSMVCYNFRHSYWVGRSLAIEPVTVRRSSAAIRLLAKRRMQPKTTPKSMSQKCCCLTGYTIAVTGLRHSR